MNIGWLRIIAAVFFEMIWVTGLKYATLPWEWLVTGCSLCGSTYFLLKSGDTLPVGTAYSVFVGLGALATILIEALGFGVWPSMAQCIFIVILISGIIGLKLLNESKYMSGDMK